MSCHRCNQYDIEMGEATRDLRLALYAVERTPESLPKRQKLAAAKERVGMVRGRRKEHDTECESKVA